MKAGWEIKKIGDVCQIVGGRTPSKANDEFYNGKILWATVRDMKFDMLSETEHRITEKAIKSSATNIIPKGNVVIATRVGLGKVCLLENDTAINQDLRGVIPKYKGKISEKYLFFWFKSIAHLIEQAGTGATVHGVKLPFVKSLEIPVPPLPEQRRIVAILDEAFAGIAAAKENAEQNLKNAKEVFEALLQDTFLNHSDDWEEKQIKKIGVTQTGITPHTSDKENYGDYIPFVKPADIDIDGFGTINYINFGLSRKGLSSGRLIKKNSILMVCIGASIGKTGFSEREISCNQQINSLTVNNDLESKFFYYALKRRSFFDKVILNSAQATLPIINKSKWESISVKYPKSIDEQRRIVSQFDSIAAETSVLESIYQQKLSNLEELKKSLLQQAFSGAL